MDMLESYPVHFLTTFYFVSCKLWFTAWPWGDGRGGTCTH